MNNIVSVVQQSSALKKDERLGSNKKSNKPKTKKCVITILFIISINDHMSIYCFLLQDCILFDYLKKSVIQTTPGFN